MLPIALATLAAHAAAQDQNQCRAHCALTAKALDLFEGAVTMPVSPAWHLQHLVPQPAANPGIGYDFEVELNARADHAGCTFTVSQGSAYTPEAARALPDPARIFHLTHLIVLPLPGRTAYGIEGRSANNAVTRLAWFRRGGQAYLLYKLCSSAEIADAVPVTIDADAAP